MTLTITGQCFCGAVRYAIEGGLRNARCCHCARCRRTFGAAGSAYAELANGATFTWLQGQDLVTEYREVPDWGRCFCSRCGSPLAGLHRAAVHGVPLGSVDGDPGVAIAMHLFVGSKAPWDHIGGSAVQYDAAAPVP